MAQTRDVRTILDIGIGRDVIRAWCTWLAPDVQPFFVDEGSDWPESRPAPAEGLTPELRDTYKVWRLRDRGEILWLDETAFTALSRPRRRRLVRSQVDRRRGAVPSVRRWADLLDVETLRDQADGQRFVWWPSMMPSSPERVLERFVAEEGDATRHCTVAASTWRSCEHVLPGARELAGTFANGSGPNCFGTVMAAAGVSGAAEAWMQQTPFDEWLAAACVRGGIDDEAGTVLVWRDSSGVPTHAAVTIGDGYALEKAGQTWWTPRVVAPVSEVKRATRAPGQRLERHQIVHQIGRAHV